MKLQQMNNNPTYQQSMCASCTTPLESNTATTRKRDDNETITTANNTVRLVPELRFPEFQNAGEWMVKKLGDITSNRDNKRQPVTKTDRIKGTYPYYGANGIQDYVDDYIFDGNYLLVGEDGSVLTSSNTPIINWVSGKFWVNNHAHVLAEKSDFSLKFISYILSTRNIQGLVTGVPPKLNQENLNSILIFIPPISDEQRKIASFLQSIDDKISATESELEQLKIHKKALLQKLFPQRGKTVPEFRFPEFQDAGEWEEVKLGDIIIVHSGRDYKHLNHGNVPVYGTGGYMLSVDDYLSEIDAVGIGRKGTIDKPQYLKAPFWTVDTLFYMTANVGYDVKFIYYLSQTIAWKKYGEQTGVPSLSKVSIENMEIYVSTNIAEQRKIADAFSSLDDSIDSCSKKISELLQHKKGLMQKLFPLNI